MITSLKKIAIIISCIALLLFFTPFRTANAIIGGCNFPGCFGGIADFEFFCDCSENFLITFAPMYFYGDPIPTVGDLAFEEGSMLFADYTILPDAAVLGTYIPGVPGCWEYVGYTCVPVEPQEGTILPFTGSSLPGAL